MRPDKKLRFWREKRRAQPSPASQPRPASHPTAASPSAASSTASGVSLPPQSAQEPMSCTAAAPVPASGAASHPLSRSQPPQPRAAPASSLFPFMHLVEHPGASKNPPPPRLVYVSLSADLRLLFADSPSTKPTSLVDFRGADCCLSLPRMSYEPPQASATSPSLESFVEPRVRAEAHPAGPAVRVTDKKRSVLLIAASEAERDALLSALRLHIAPWPLLRKKMEAEMRAAGAPSASAPSLADAARELLSGATAGAPGASAGATTDARGKGVAQVVWEKAGTVAQMSLWGATFGQGLGGVVRTAEELEKLAKPLGGLTVVGCAFSLVALSARAVGLMGMEAEERDKLVQAWEDLREASVSFVGWLFGILRSGFTDEDDLVGKVFNVLGECWDGAEKLERYLLRNWAVRVWSAEDVGIIVGKVEAVTGKLLAAGLLNVVARHERQIFDLEDKAFVADKFRSYAPEPYNFSVGLVGNAATSLAQLKAAVLLIGSAERSTGVGDTNEPGSGSGLRCVALTSIDGEGGVGKTSTCKLFCVDEEVRAFYSDGAILWLDVGKDATEEKVKGELRSAVLMCGGGRSAELMDPSSCDVKAAVDIARLFFARRRVLVIADNIWETPVGSTVTSWTETLSKIVSGPGGAVITTTRFIFLSRSPGFSRVKLGRLDLSTEEGQDWRIAENLYDALLDAETEVQSSGEYRKRRRSALILSCGLPLGITTFAGLVHSYSEIGDDEDTVLSNIEQRFIGLADEAVGEDLKASTGHLGLFAAMEESLSYLDQRERKVRRVKSTPLSVLEDVDGNDIRSFRSSYDAFSGEPLSARYAALEMIPTSSTSMSFLLLRRLWHVPTVAAAKSIALLFVNIGLGRIEDAGDKSFVLHDLQHGFCARICERSTGATLDARTASAGHVNGHALFLSSCESLLGSEKSGGDGDVEWANFCFSDAPIPSQPLLRQYLAQNLFRHLCAAAVAPGSGGVRWTILNLLTDYHWLRCRIAEFDRASVLSDCTFALTARSYISTSSSARTPLLTGSAEMSIRALREGLMLVGDGTMAHHGVSRESDGILASALVQLTQASVVGGAVPDVGLFRKLACSTEENVLGAWLKPIRGCSRARDESVLAQAVVGRGFWVRSLVALGDGAHFVSGNADGVVRVHESEHLFSVLELKGHADDVNCVEVAKREDVEDSFLVFSCSDDGYVRSWEVCLEPARGLVQRTCDVIGNCKSRVWCVSVSEGGKLVAAGCENGHVFIWKRRHGELALLFDLVTTFRCSVAEKEPSWVRGVAVSRSGDLVVAGEENGDVAFWSSGEPGMDEAVDRYSASGESDARLRHILLSEDEASVCIVFDQPAGREVWDTASRGIRDPRVSLPKFHNLQCAMSSNDGDSACLEGSGARDVFAAGGCGESFDEFISLYSTDSDLKLLSTYPLASAARSVCYTSLGSVKVILVGSDDRCVRMLDASLPAGKDGVEHYEEGARSLVNTSSDASDAPDLAEVSALAVMPRDGHVPAGHGDGRLSLWCAESGEFVRAFEDRRGDFVICVDISADDRLVVSGHRNCVALVWDSSTWKCHFALEGHSRGVACATIAADAKRILSVDWDGVVRLWDAESGGSAQWTIETRLEDLGLGSRGATNLDGGHFLWARRDGDGDRIWHGKLIVVGRGRVVSQSEETGHLQWQWQWWDKFLESMPSGQGFGCKEEGLGRFGAVYENRFVELRVISSNQQSTDLWRVLSGTDHGGFLPRIEGELLSADRGQVPVAASLGFDSNIDMVAAGGITAKADKPSAIRRCLQASWEVKPRDHAFIVCCQKLKLLLVIMMRALCYITCSRLSLN